MSNVTETCARVHISGVLAYSILAKYSHGVLYLRARSLCDGQTGAGTEGATSGAAFATPLRKHPLTRVPGKICTCHQLKRAPVEINGET